MKVKCVRFLLQLMNPSYADSLKQNDDFFFLRGGTKSKPLPYLSLQVILGDYYCAKYDSIPTYRSQTQPAYTLISNASIN